MHQGEEEAADIIRRQVLRQLRQVQEPDLLRDVVSLGLVQDLDVDQGAGAVKFCLRRPTPICSNEEGLKSEVSTALLELDWVKNVNVSFETLDVKRLEEGCHRNLRNVTFIVAVSSCKGGVGKSTIALALALMLRRKGARVGILDADVYGPNLPALLGLSNSNVCFSDSSDEDDHDNERTIIGFNNKRVTGSSARSETETSNILRQNKISYDDTPDQQRGRTCSAKQKVNSSIRPLLFSGLKCMSYGFIAKHNSDGFSALRGPFVSGVVQQLLTGTKWGRLDYLIIDLPPGTGDIHMTISDEVQVDGCVVVTTAQTLSTTDAEKGVRMFNRMGIPTLCLVENMSEFVCDSCGKHHRLFEDAGRVQDLVKLCNVDRVFSIPLDPRISSLFAEPKEAEGLNSFVDVTGDDDPTWGVLSEMAERVSRELVLSKFGGRRTNICVSHDGYGLLVSFLRPSSIPVDEGGYDMDEHVYELSAALLHKKCSITSRNRMRRQTVKEQKGTPVIAKIEEDSDSVQIFWSDDSELRVSIKDLESMCRVQSKQSNTSGSKYGSDELQW